MVSDSFREQLASRFTGLWQRCLLPGCQADIDLAWQELAQRYDEAHRLYHTLRHLDFCLRQFDATRNLITDADAVEMAIWYHDIINYPQANNNELQSKILFECIAQNIFDPAFVARVSTLIMVTTHRQTPQTQDEAYICDIDLSSMGESWVNFITDSNDLRAESESSLEEYTLGKFKFFNALLERPRIFYTEHFFSQYEHNAHKNIQRYMDILNQEG